MSGDIGRGATRDAIKFALHLASANNKPKGVYYCLLSLHFLNLQYYLFFFYPNFFFLGFIFSYNRVSSVSWWYKRSHSRGLKKGEFISDHGRSWYYTTFITVWFGMNNLIL